MTQPTPPHWDLSNVYPGLDSEEFGEDFRKLQNLLGDFDTYYSNEMSGIGQVDNKALAGVMSGAVDHLNKIVLLAGTLNAYIHSFITTDSYNNQAQRLNSEFEQMDVRLSKQLTRLKSWLGRYSEQLPKALEFKGTAQQHAFFLEEMLDLSRHLMSEPEEVLAAELSLSGANAWGKLQRTVTSQIKTEIELDGQKMTLPITAVINLRSHPDEAVRRRAYEVENQVWDQYKAPLASAMNGIKGSANVLNRHRGWEDPLEPSLKDSRIDRETLEAMLDSVQASRPMFERYFRAKARRLGKDRLAWWDLFAPLGAVESIYTFDEARDFILSNFETFSPDLSAFARRAFENRWIDAEQRPGKVAGAFCMSIPAVKESRVLCNFDGSLDQVFTIAHELGHGFHNNCQFEAGKTELQRINPRTLAETASIMCETIMLHAALEQASSPEEELSILETSLTSDSQVIIDIYSRFLFESEVFERRQEAELSAEELCDIMARSQKTAYGSGLDPNYLQPYMWTWKPHYYNQDVHFYNYPYTFGLLFGIGLYSVYLERGKEFVPEYKKLLSNTGEASPADLAKRFGIDIRKPEFWQSGIQVIEKRVDRYIHLKI